MKEKLRRLTLRAAMAVGSLAILAGLAAAVHWAVAGEGLLSAVVAAWGAVTVLAGVAAVACAALLWSARPELDRLRREREILEAERATEQTRVRGLERRAERLSLVREIHRSTNIVARGERLRQMLTLVGHLGEAVEAALFAQTDRAGACEATDSDCRLWPVAYLRSGTDRRVFVRFDRPIAPGAGIAVTNVGAASSGTRHELACDMEAGGERVGRIEAVLHSEVLGDPNEVLTSMLSAADLDTAAADAVLDHGRVLRTEDRPRGHVELLYPLAAEGSSLGALRVRLPANAVSSDACLRELEEDLSECTRHVALVLKKESDARIATTDGLTGLLSRREFEPRLAEIMDHAAEWRLPVALIFVDIDHFKRVNDTHGHRTGDMALRGIAAVVRQQIRACDSAFRYGGEELCVVLPGSSTREAKATAERLRAAVEEARFTCEGGQVIGVTISLGISAFDPRRSKGARATMDAGELVRRADEAVYAAKDNGRNQVVSWTSRMKPRATTARRVNGGVGSGRTSSARASGNRQGARRAGPTKGRMNSTKRKTSGRPGSAQALAA